MNFNFKLLESYTNAFSFLSFCRLQNIWPIFLQTLRCARFSNEIAMSLRNHFSALFGYDTLQFDVVVLQRGLINFLNVSCTSLKRSYSFFALILCCSKCIELKTSRLRAVNSGVLFNWFVRVIYRRHRFQESKSRHQNFIREAVRCFVECT